MPPTDRVEIVRLTYDVFIVTAYDLFGRTIRQRQYATGSSGSRRRFAIEQAKQWANRWGLWFDERTCIFN